MRHSEIARNPSQVVASVFAEAESDSISRREISEDLEVWIQLVIEETRPKTNAVPENAMANPLRRRLPVRV